MVGKKIKDAVYISNPPFGNVDVSEKTRQLLFSQGLVSGNYLVKKCRAEVVFIARVLEIASEGDEAVFILPTSLLENTCFKQIRRALCEMHNLHTCFLLPERTFKGTEVRTAIVWFRPHAAKPLKSVKIFLEGDYEIEIDSSSFVEHGIITTPLNDKKDTTLSSRILSIKRGKSTKRNLISRNINHIHTTDLNRRHAQIIHGSKSNNTKMELLTENVARDGDILIARVGTRVLGKAAVFSGSETVISDCVVRLRVADSDRNIIFKQLVSDQGQRWLKRVATGSCAKILTYDAINNFPLTL